MWGALGGVATALGVLAFLSKKLVGHFFSKDLESHKAALKAEIDTQLEAMKAENSKDLEGIRSQLAISQAEGDARREYEFDARKRLYQEYEPLLFQLIEACENAVYRVQSLARVARDGYLKPNSGWLSAESYYLLSTIYNLMAPMAIFRMIQRRLTIG